MAHIFLSYAREDIETARRLAAALHARGWEVWWDTRLKAGEIWDEAIERALKSACCIVVLWSTASVDRRYVRAEAKFGFDRDMLVPAVIESAVPPFIFCSVQHENLTGWAGEDDHASLVRLLDAVSGFVGTPSADVAIEQPSVPVTPGLRNSLEPHTIGRVGGSATVVDDPRPPFAQASGKDEFGRWIDVAVPSAVRSGAVTQRFRWIERGSFWMGSPDDEPERMDSEGPRHWVTLTRGFWLADTTCTQALWRVVMGTNPSRFKDADRPVEQVSWHGVQNFLARLKERVPGADPRLPTEAEWEYACRAGTDTPFCFGAQTTPEQVNYNGFYPYAGGKIGAYREKTVAVKSLPPNAWGLYEMHGNVYEWCADALRSYTDELQVDPVGELGEGDAAPRAIRGGSWYDGARGSGPPTASRPTRATTATTWAFACP